jgi:hypothetical protein
VKSKVLKLYSFNSEYFVDHDAKSTSMTDYNEYCRKFVSKDHLLKELFENAIERLNKKSNDKKGTFKNVKMTHLQFIYILVKELKLKKAEIIKIEEFVTEIMNSGGL